jgi:lauroyl/myristoyl acyltransferase
VKLTKTKSFRRFQSAAMNGALRCVESAMKCLPQKLVRRFVDVAFLCASFLTKRLNEICVRNLRQVYGATKTEKEYQDAAQGHLKAVGHSMMDLLYYLEHPDLLKEIVNIPHEDRLRDALAEGRGVIAVSAHMGNFPLMFVSLVQRGYKVNVIIRPMRDPAFSEFMFKLCAKWQIRMIQTNPPKPFFRECLAALRRNELLFILLDEAVAKEDGVSVMFMNREVTRAPGPMLFFKRTGSPILPMFMVQDDDKHFQICIEPVFHIHQQGKQEDNLVQNIAGLTRIIEDYVRRYPLQWGGWLNKRWSLTNITELKKITN